MQNLSLLEDIKQEIKSALIDKQLPIFGGLSTYAKSIAYSGISPLPEGTQCRESSFTVLPGYDFSMIKDMSYMFYECLNLVTVPKLNTLAAINMSGLFVGCQALVEIQKIDTLNVTDMHSMFASCTSLTTIPQLDTSKVTTMCGPNYGGMFTWCESLTSIPQMDTSNVTNMKYMFYGCESLTTIPLMDTSKVTDISYMLDGCRSLKNLGGFIGLRLSLKLSNFTLLTHESLMNVINNLADVHKEPLVKTLTLGEWNINKLTTEEIAIATGKGWIVN